MGKVFRGIAVATLLLGTLLGLAAFVDYVPDAGLLRGSLVFVLTVIGPIVLSVFWYGLGELFRVVAASELALRTVNGTASVAAAKQNEIDRNVRYVAEMIYKMAQQTLPRESLPPSALPEPTSQT